MDRQRRRSRRPWKESPKAIFQASNRPARAFWNTYKIDWGPGYRIYFGKDGETLVILVGGGIKKRQSSDIKAAKAHWADYKKRKK
jgi:putative addiction module killer protein